MMEEDITTLLDRIAETIEGVDNVQIQSEKLKQSFLYHYPKCYYKANTKNPFRAARYNRRCMAQAVLTAQENLSNQTSCLLLNSQFSKYCRLMDNKQGVNNQADHILNELSAIGATADGPSSWHSQTDMVQLMLRKTNPTPASCVNQNENGGCTSGDITAENIKFLLQNKKKNESLLSLKIQNVREAKPWEKYSSQNPQIPINRQLPDFKTNNKVVSPKPAQRDSFLRTVENRVFGGQKRNVSSYPTDSGFVKRPKSYNGFQGNEDEKAQTGDSGMFRTAGTELRLQNFKKYGRAGPPPSAEPYMNNRPGGSGDYNYGTNKKSLGGRTRTINNKFVPPVKQQESQDGHDCYEDAEKEKLDERLQLIDPKMVELIQSEIIESGVGIGWDDIAGLHFAKTTLQEIVVLPMLRPDIFTGLRRPPRGILLFGPPGTGKTLIGKCVASQSKSTFFSISASSLTSKWIGDGEKMVRALFTVARVYQPAVIFIDEIDSLLGQRNDGEHESSRRLKTEFLIHLDGTGTKEDEHILLIGATNRPQDLDEAVRRRFVKRLYIPLPDHQARSQIIRNLLLTERNNLAPDEVEKIAELTDGYSAADMKNVCKEASLGPLRSLSFTELEKVSPSKVRPVAFEDFKSAVSCVRSSVASDDLSAYTKWDEKYGAGGAPK